MSKFFTSLTNPAIWAFCLLPFSFSSHGDINITLAAPTWDFILQNQPLAQKEARISPHERSFSKRIQPLLAQQKYQEVIAAFAQRLLTKDSAALCQLRGQVHLMLKQYDQAEQSLQQALRLAPNLALAHRSISMIYMVKKSYKQAQKHLTKTIELGVADAQVFGQLAYVNLQLNQSASAVAGYQYALFLEPSNQQWRQGLLYALLNSQAYDQAQALLEEMLPNNMDSSSLWLQRGQLALKQNRLPQAISSLEMAIQLGEKNVENLTTAVQLHIQAGSPQRAVAIMADNMATFLDKQAAKSIAAVDQISAWLVYQQNWQQLTTLLTAVAQSNVKLATSTQAKFDVYSAQLAISANNTDQAQHKLKQALKHDPSHGEALLTLASLVWQQHKDERAAIYYTRAQALSGYKERALLGHAQLEIDRKKYSTALSLLRQVIQFNPNRSDVLANIQSLENLVRNQS